jgi:hypothetical protein
MGKPTFDNGIPRPWSRDPDFVPGNRAGGLGLPLSNEGMRSLNKIGGFKRTQGTETSQYLEERTSTETPLVVASERGPGQWRMRDNRNRLESRALAGDSPVRVMQTFVLE